MTNDEMASSEMRKWKEEEERKQQELKEEVQVLPCFTIVAWKKAERGKGKAKQEREWEEEER